MAQQLMQCDECSFKLVPQGNNSLAVVNGRQRLWRHWGSSQALTRLKQENRDRRRRMICDFCSASFHTKAHHFASHIN
jgi:hypothetical protein